ncbi:MAG: hypothetical protein H8D23_37750 [Candidatus Brocadiales bacterium]|nr:hypothetical protein [Candidatus Brocadiales bacterium]
MMRKNLVLFTLILIAILSGCLTNANQSGQTTVPSVSGTTWTGKDSDGEYSTYNFLPDGKLHYDIQSGFWQNGSWKQNGNNIYFEMNNKFSVHVGTISGNKMKGTGLNTEGHEWTWKAKKK